MNKLISGIIIVCLSISAGALAADGTVSTPKSAQNADGAKPVADQADKVAPKTNCIKETGSHLNSKDKNGCNGLPGRSYDKDDIDMTGATSVGEALQRLDPAIQVGR